MHPSAFLLSFAVGWLGFDVLKSLVDRRVSFTVYIGIGIFTVAFILHLSGH